MDNFDPEKCPVGIKNGEQLSKMEGIFELMIQRLEEKIDTVNEDVNEGFAKVDTRFNNLEDRFNTLEKNLPSTVDNQIKQHDEERASRIVKWVLVSLLGSTVILVFGRWVLSLLNF